MQFRTGLISLAFFALLNSPQVSAQNVNTTFRAKMNFPGQTLANVWGYTAGGKEYALLGGSKGMIVVDITNPDAPQQIVQIPAPEGSQNGGSLWKEIKTYQHYAYLVTEAGGGVQIIDLSNLPSPNLAFHAYKGDGAILDQLNDIHALHIDESKGFLYAWGGGLLGGGAKIMDLKTDPWNPVYVGKYDQLGYIHDGYVDNDTMYSGHIYAGQFAIVNMADKSAPELINTQTTPNAFTHNTWLAQDRKTLLTTDETANSYLTAYDVSDPTDIKLLDKMQGTPGSGSAIHNTYALGKWAISSWYRDGFNMVDISRPDNLVQVGNYDTYPNASGSGFNGCWGVYPYFPSGTIIASNITPAELYIISPNYVDACFLEGKITAEDTGLPIYNAKIQVIGTNPMLQEFSALNGGFKTGQELEGSYTVRISKKAYQDFDTIVQLQHGQVVELNVALRRYDVNVSVIRHDDGQPVVNARVWLYGTKNNFEGSTDNTGVCRFQNVPYDTYDIAASSLGLGLGMLAGQTITGKTNATVELFPIHRRNAVQERGLPQSSRNLLLTTQNPFENETIISLQTPVVGGFLLFFNSLGQRISSASMEAFTGQFSFGAGLPAGIYFVVLSQNGITLDVEKLIKE